MRIRNINAGLFSYINAASWWNLFCVSRCCAKSTGWTGITGGADAFVQSYDHGGGICCRHDRESLSASGGMGLFRTAVQFSRQICLLYCNLWFWLSGPVIVLHDLMEHFLLNVPMQHYKIFSMYVRLLLRRYVWIF